MTDSVAVMIDELLADSPGSALRKARENQALSVRDVAERLRLLPRQVEALEADDYQNLNGDIFCRGYLKSYGKLLGLDSDVLIEAYLQIRPEVSDKTNYAPKNTGPEKIQTLNKGHSIQYWFLAATIIVIALLWLAFGGSNGEGNNAELVIESEVVVDKQLTVEQLQEAERASVVPIVEPLLTTAPEKPESEIVATPSAASMPVATEKETVQVAAQPAVENVVASKPEALLLFGFENDCWVQVIDGNKDVIFADLKRANDSLELNGVAPFKVLLGYAPGVSLEYNGDPVTININRENNSARFVVGTL